MSCIKADYSQLFSSTGDTTEWFNLLDLLLSGFGKAGGDGPDFTHTDILGLVGYIPILDENIITKKASLNKMLAFK